MKKILSAILSLFFLTSAVQAQSYSPDRPGIGNGSSITPKNVFGVEAGLQFTYSEFVDRFDLGQVLLRYGISERLEFRAFLNSYTTVKEDYVITQKYSGFSDMALGAKYNLVFGGEGIPNVSTLVEVSLPVGSDAYSDELIVNPNTAQTDGSDPFTSDEIVPVVTLLVDHAFSNVWGISSNIAYTYEVGDLDYNWLFTFTPVFNIPGIENLAGYFGYAGIYYGNSININEHWLEGGLTYGLEDGTQLDVNLGYETESEAFFIGAGFAKGF